LVAIWEILHSGDRDNWFDGSDVRDLDPGNWAIERDHRDLPSDPLRPFRKDGGNYWTSNDTRATVPHGYTYPELEKWKHVDSHGNYDAAAHKEALAAYVNTRYNAAARAAVKAQLTADPSDSPQISSNKPNLLQLQIATPDPRPAQDIIGFNDYVVNIVYNRFALAGRPYTIHIFVGKVPDRVPYTFDDPEGSLVGQVYTFSSPADTFGTDAEIGCINCRSQEAAEVESSGTVPLTNALITRWKNQLQHTPRQRLVDGEAPRVLASMEPQDVVPFLEANFRWRVTSSDGLLSPEELPSLRVSVAVGKADHYADPKKLSRFYDYKGANKVTENRPQGAGPGDGLYPPGQEYTVQG
jgi:tyrosinase